MWQIQRKHLFAKFASEGVAVKFCTIALLIMDTFSRSNALEESTVYGKSIESSRHYVFPSVKIVT